MARVQLVLGSRLVRFFDALLGLVVVLWKIWVLLRLSLALTHVREVLHIFRMYEAFFVPEHKLCLGPRH